MVIGLAGAQGSGKDTSCKLIAEILAEVPSPTYQVVRDAFADRLKVSAVRALWGDIGLDNPAYAIKLANQLKEHGAIGITIGEHYQEITGRQFLQFYGTEAHRDVFGQDFWLSAVFPDPKDTFYGREDLEDIFVTQNKIPVLVITDIRLPNEAEIVREAGGEVWQIVKPSDTIDTTHKSEIPIPEELVDHVITNDGSFDDLRETLRALITRPVGEVVGVPIELGHAIF